MAITATLIGALGLAVGGCGTVGNLTGGPSGAEPPHAYGGVRLDVESAAANLTDSSGGHGGLPGRLVQVCVVAPYLLLIDLPLSVVGDTLTLPLSEGTANNSILPNGLPALSGNRWNPLAYPDPPPGRDDRQPRLSTDAAAEER
jgi:uncharacterized protein YceK